MRYRFELSSVIRFIAFLIILGALRNETLAGNREDSYAQTYVTITAPGFPGESNYRQAALLAKHLRRHIPDHPRILVHMKRGSVATANYAHNAMPSDGRHLFMPGQTTVVQQILDLDKVRYDVRNMVWLGMANQMNCVLVAHRSAGVKTVLDLKRKHMVVAVDNFGSSNQILPKLARDLIGLRLTLLRGYDNGEIGTMIAMRAELLGAGAAFPWASWRSFVPHWFSDGIAKPILQTGYAIPHDSSEMASSNDGAGQGDRNESLPSLRATSWVEYLKHPDLPKVPLLKDLVDGNDRTLVDLIWSRAMLGQALALPPGVTRKRVSILRASFSATMNDREYLAQAKKLGVFIRPVNGAKLQQRITSLFATTNETLLAQARYLLGAGGFRHR